ncbi:DUF5710 domain-containing protein [Rhodoferax sp.]|uniref:DUF5710 domain-containing protein n=1 Tax=Rhodoferax sp. TaxID=50421 RepID=UPI00374DACF0
MKALGARWAVNKKIWYIADVADLTPFLRWIPNLAAATEDSTDGAARPTKSSPKASINQSKDPPPSPPLKCRTVDAMFCSGKIANTRLLSDCHDR